MKKIIAGILVASCILQNNAISARAMSLFYAASGRSGVNVYVEAQFADGVKTTNTDYGLEKDKYVSKVTIRLREGDYDETDSTTQGGHLIRLEKINNPLKTASGSWSWEYK